VGEGQHRAAAIEKKGIVGIHVFQGFLRDRFFLQREQLCLVIKEWLIQASFQADRAAVNFPDMPLLVQLAQVAANRRGGDAQFIV
jgi:hypothetical protein